MRTRSSLFALLGDNRPQRRNPNIEAIWEIISRIPAGAVTTYGDVAIAAGLPRRARLAAYALRTMDESTYLLPWHRVVRAGGRIAFPPGSTKFREQARLLRGDGVTVKNGKVAKESLVTMLE